LGRKKALGSREAESFGPGGPVPGMGNTPDAGLGGDGKWIGNDPAGEPPGVGDGERREAAAAKLFWVSGGGGRPSKSRDEKKCVPLYKRIMRDRCKSLRELQFQSMMLFRPRRSINGTGTLGRYLSEDL
jgi:hypothetical protein